MRNCACCLLVARASLPFDARTFLGPPALNQPARMLMDPYLLHLDLYVVTICVCCDDADG